VVMSKLCLSTLRRLWREESAATATEYAVMLALVLAVIIATLSALGANLTSSYQSSVSACFGS